jgi:hypothetical protein
MECSTWRGVEEDITRDSACISKQSYAHYPDPRVRASKSALIPGKRDYNMSFPKAHTCLLRSASTG